MAYITVKYYSNALNRPTSFELILPGDFRQDLPKPENEHQKRPTKTLFLLHGYNGCAGSWLPDYFADVYNIAIVMPNGENGFWLDGISTGHKFATLIGEEIPDYLRRTFGLCNGPDDTYISGYSMGGFGALRTALAYPDRFGKTGAMSSALIVRGIAGFKPDEPAPMANYEYYRECFGELDKVIESENNPEVLIDKLLSEGRKLPEIYMCCGTEDFLIEPNREFHRFLESRKVQHIYIEDKGIHDMVFWSDYGKKIVEWMFG